MAGLLARGKPRLLTLTGAGGIGKTRLGIEASRRAEETFPDGVAFVALAPLGGADLVMPTALQALGLRGAAGVPPLEVLCQYLARGSTSWCSTTSNTCWKRHPKWPNSSVICPDLRVLATSRAPLRVRDEREYPISPLAVPDPDRTPEANEVSRAPAARLFVERASEASPGFSLTPTNAAAVASICWRLEGLPLALELAAARSRFLGPTALLSRLDQALQAGGARDLPERQRTMRSTLDWSRELLSGAEQDLFARLSVFSGGFTLEAAEAVGAGGGTPKEEVLVLLGNLVEQSLVLAEAGEGGDELRYRMLEPVRQYALEKLEDGGETPGFALGCFGAGGQGKRRLLYAGARGGGRAASRSPAARGRRGAAGGSCGPTTRGRTTRCNRKRLTPPTSSWASGHGKQRTTQDER